MALDEEINEDLVIRNFETGNVFLSFDSKNAKEGFLNILKNMTDKNKRNKEEGYKCGNCAAYPCFRTISSQILAKGLVSGLKHYEERAKKEALRSAGLCFQHVRLCRQECNFYIKKETEEFWPGGVCKKDNSDVTYEQECHIDDIKKSRL